MQTDFIAYVRHEEKLLLLRRHSSDASFPGLWDGVYGSGSTPEEVLARVAEVTGLSVDQLVLHKEGPDRGIDMGRTLVDVIPYLVVSSSDEVTPAGVYDAAEWIDPGNLQDIS